MTLLITIASLAILTFSMNNYTRTFVLVFLPLSIIWLQVYISSKIPVIKYYTLMEQLLITCFIITIINAIESAFVFILLNNKYEWLTLCYTKIVGIETNYHEHIKNIKIINNKKEINKDIYNGLTKHVLLIDTCYKVLINFLFIVSISILLK